LETKEIMMKDKTRYSSRGEGKSILGAIDIYAEDIRVDFGF
jgi:hypothetical protein